MVAIVDPDEDLVRRVGQGDPAAAQTLVSRKLPRILSLAQRMLGDAVEAHFPSDPFWYLHIAGVDPARQGRGLGGASIRAGLARCDADGVPAYLETATESNVGLYARLGFELTGEWSVPKGGPRFWSMMRPVGA